LTPHLAGSRRNASSARFWHSLRAGQHSTERLRAARDAPLRLVDELVSTVVARARVSLRILVRLGVRERASSRRRAAYSRHYGANSLHDGAGHKVLGRNELKPLPSSAATSAYQRLQCRRAGSRAFHCRFFSCSMMSAWAPHGATESTSSVPHPRSGAWLPPHHLRVNCCELAVAELGPLAVQ